MSQYCTGGSQETAERRQGDAGVPHPPLQTQRAETQSAATLRAFVACWWRTLMNYRTNL